MFINGVNDELILAARLLLATLFLIFGWRKLRDFSGTVSQMGAYEVREGWYQPSGQAKRNRLRRMLGSGRMVVASSQMRRMRSHRLL
jgi:hypothetical protein